MDVEADRARNEADVAKDILLSRTNGIDAVLQANHLDAILTPAANGADLAARAGYPLLVVPFGMVPNTSGQQPFPAGFSHSPRLSVWASPGRPAASRDSRNCLRV